MRYLLVWFILLGSKALLGQYFLDDFESGNLQDWEVISGIADLATAPTVNGDYSLRLWNHAELEWPEAIIRHRTFKEDFGLYSYYAQGDGVESDADFFFQFIDINNYYSIAHHPSGTDDPEFLVFKVVDGIYTELYRQDAVEETGVWIYIRIFRTCYGRLEVEFNNDCLLDIIDTDIMIPGSIGLRSWGEFSYFDRIAFEADESVPEVVNETICFGQQIIVGVNTYDSTGTYLDTLKAVSGCDSIIQLELQVVEGLETIIDTVICSGVVISFGEQIITEPGGYSEGFMTDKGCDSTVIWNVFSTPILDLGRDQNLCDKENIRISVGNQSGYLWSDSSTDESLIIDEVGTYSLEIIDLNNCIQRDSIRVVNQCELELATANIFTPDGDNVNDEWKPSFEVLPSTYELYIYNRWGNLQFQSYDPNESWDGKSADGSAINGTYIWLIVADTQIFSGDLTIVR